MTLEALRQSHGKGFKIGTNAVRRAAYARRLFPGVEVIHFRGRRRHARAKAREWREAAPAGWRRRRSGRCADHGALRPRSCRPRRPHRVRIHSSGDVAGGGAGIVAVECAAQDWQTRQILSSIDDPVAHASADAEREVLWVPQRPLQFAGGGFSTIAGDRMSLTASVLDLSATPSSRLRAKAPPIAARARPCGGSGSSGEGRRRDHRAQPTALNALIPA